jgi:hypothetical protein
MSLHDFRIHVRSAFHTTSFNASEALGLDAESFEAVEEA